MEILKSTFETITDIIFATKKEIAFCVPNISDEVASALVQRKDERDIKVKVFLNFTEKSYRAGFGDIKGYEKLAKNDIPVFNINQYNIYCIIADEMGYFYFPQSRFHQKEGESFDLFPMQIQQVKQIKIMLGMVDDTTAEWENLVEDVGVETLENVAKTIKPILESESKILVSKINNDPPLKPEFGRSLETYKAKFQFVELIFHGGNMAVKKIPMPQKALPFKDDNLKKSIEANLRLFDNLKQQDFLKPFLELKAEVDQIRENFTYHIKTRKKSLIIREKKADFEFKLNELTTRIEKVRTSLINDLQSEIAKTRVTVSENLLNFLTQNKPKELDGLIEFALKGEIDNMCNNIMSKIHFPLAKDLLDEIKLKWQYYDITWEDLNNQKILLELREKKLINEDEQSFISELAIAAKKEI